MTDIDSLGGLVTRILDGLASDTLVLGFREPIKRGSASGAVTIVEDSEDPGTLLLEITLAIMTVPEDAAPFYRRLLELNHGFKGRAAFSVDSSDQVWLTSGRPLRDLDPGEVIDLLLWTSEQADHFDDLLLTEFGYEYKL